VLLFPCSCSMHLLKASRQVHHYLTYMLRLAVLLSPVNRDFAIFWQVTIMLTSTCQLVNVISSSQVPHNILTSAIRMEIRVSSLSAWPLMAFAGATISP